MRCRGSSIECKLLDRRWRGARLLSCIVMNGMYLHDLLSPRFVVLIHGVPLESRISGPVCI